MKVGLAHSPPMIENAVNEWSRYLDLLVSPFYHFTVAEVVVEGKIGRHDFRLVTLDRDKVWNKLKKTFIKMTCKKDVISENVV